MINYWKIQPFKLRNRILLGIGAVVFLLIFPIAISATVQQYKQMHVLTLRVRKAAQAPSRIKICEKKLQSLELKLVQVIRADPVKQQMLLEMVSRSCKQQHLVLTKFPGPTTSSEEGYELETYAFTAKGPFKGLLKLAYNLEQEEKAGRICSLVFEKRKDGRTKRSFLTATFYLQILKTS